MFIKGLFVLAVNFISVSSLFSTDTQTITRCARGQCESGMGLYPHCDDCKKFIYCIFGHPIVKTCPNDLLFDITRAVCNHPADSKCWDPSNIVHRDGLTGYRPGGRYNQDSLNAPPNARQPQEESGLLQDNYGLLMKSGDILAKPNIKEPSRYNIIPKEPENRHQNVDASANFDARANGNRLNVDSPANGIPVPQLSNGDVSAVPVSMRTDDPPLGFDQDGHEVNRQNVDAPANEIRVPQLSNGDVSAVPVSMRTDDPPIGYDENGYEVRNKVAESFSSINENNQRQHPNGDVSVVPVSMKTDDPPMGFDNDGHELRSHNADSSPRNENGDDNIRQHVSMQTDDPPLGYDKNGHELSNIKEQMSNVDSQKVSKSEHTNDESEKNLEELATLGTDDPPEDWNRDYTINPDFEGLENSEQLTGESDTSLRDTQKEVNSQSSQLDGGVSELNLPLLPMGLNRQSSLQGDKNTDLPNLHQLGGSLELPILGESALNKKPVDTAQMAKSLVPCVVNCSGLTAGNYQSCTDCSSYTSCMMGFMFTNTCPTNNYWDDIVKQCLPKSSTCN